MYRYTEVDLLITNYVLRLLHRLPKVVVELRFADSQVPVQGLSLISRDILRTVRYNIAQVSFITSTPLIDLADFHQLSDRYSIILANLLSGTATQRIYPSKRMENFEYHLYIGIDRKILPIKHISPPS